MNPELVDLHAKAKSLASQYRKVEAQLLAVLIQIENQKAYLPLGYDSLFQYCLQELGLTESHSYAFMSIARKSREVPELKEAVEKNEMSLSNARRLVSVITSENKESWLAKGKALSQRELEKEVVRANPGPAVVERVRPVTETESELRVGLDAQMEIKLRRVKALMGTGSAKEALNAMLDDYLKRHDPVKKAERAKLCPGTVVKATSRAIPREVFHAVQRRDQGRCQFKSADGKPCLSERWVEVHHIKPWALGGKHEVGNLTTLCERHHHWHHRENAYFASWK